MKSFLFAAVAVFAFAGAAFATDNYVSPIQAVAAQCDAACAVTSNQNIVSQQVVTQSYAAPIQTQSVRVVERIVQPQVYHEVQTIVAAPVQLQAQVVQRQYVQAPLLVQQQRQYNYVRQNLTAQPVIAQRQYVRQQNFVQQQNVVQHQQHQQQNFVQQRQYIQQQQNIQQQNGYSNSSSQNFSSQQSNSGGGRLFGNIFGGGGRSVNRSFNFSSSSSKSR